ncbi:unnamed protein product, partial [Rotaria magnacalcarata]
VSSGSLRVWYGLANDCEVVREVIGIGEAGW